ncbi:FAD/NAD(P)-binding protein [bacterium]|nr:FAD/NAD(P)-binding protein [bacterium]MBU1651694.1 FAD/NAD(P)-binding protein [bacterium]
MKARHSEPMIPQPFRVAKVQKETFDTFTLQLKSSKGNGVSHFSPGQFNMLYVFGVGEVPISISGDPSNGTLIHTTRVVGNVTKAMGKLKVGDVIGVRGPFGTPWPVENAKGKDVVIVTGGIGLAPLRPALYYFLKHRDEYGKIVLLYGARSKEDILYRRELEQWRARFDLEVHVTVDRGTGNWRGNVGVVTMLIPKAPFDAHNAVSLVCGPEIMMRFTVLELLKRGIPESKIFLSLERNMKCGIGHCGHCQFGPHFTCKDGPVFPYDQIKDLLEKREI